jgi:peptidyl-prolyl cis-trans isomerase B (cyclophilin B)
LSHITNGTNGADGSQRGGAGEKRPVVRITVENQGEMLVELYPEKAPETCANFLKLVGSGFYNGLTFHRIIPGFMIQGGCPDGNGMGGPGYSIRGEFSKNGFTANNVAHDRGVLSMARSAQPDSAGSQFFICHDAAPHLNGSYAAFGKVTEGLDVLDKIAGVKTDSGDRPREAQVIRSITQE